MRLALRLLPLVLASCASAPRVQPPPEPPTVDWAAAGQEAVSQLAAYLQVDTRNPPGNERAGAEFLAALLRREGISSTLYEFAPGRASLVARLPAVGAPQQRPLCLMSHLDVVPAEDGAWPPDAQPLSGAIKEGFVWGRGALDMKSMGILEAFTLVQLKRQGIALRRDVVLVAVGDEEVDNLGVKDLLDHHWDNLDCGVLLNEGGVGLRDLLFEGQTVFPITVAERGTLWLRVTARGEPGHGSTPVPGRAPGKLLAALERLAARAPPPRIHGSLYELLARAGTEQGGVEGWIAGRPWLVDLLVTPKLMAQPPTRAALTNSCQVTGLEGHGTSPNVVPGEVSAIVDCRVRPDTQPGALLEELRTLLGPEVELQVLHAQPGSESPWDDPFFQALAREVTRGLPRAVAGPAISPGYTDSNLVRPRGTRAYGLVPIVLDEQLLRTMHGNGERVPVTEIHRGLEVLFRAVVSAAGAR